MGAPSARFQIRNRKRSVYHDRSIAAQRPIVHSLGPMRLLRITIFASVIALAVPLVQGQPVSSGVVVGLHADVFGEITDEDRRTIGIHSETAFSYHFGFYADVDFGSLTTRLSVLYTNVGGLLGVVGSSNGLLTYEEELAFIAVPVDFSLQLPLSSLKLYALFGPESRFRLAGDVDGNKLSHALNVGLGLDMGDSLPRGGFVELRYAQGLTSLFRGSVSAPAGKASGLHLRLGIGLVRL